MIIAIVGCTHGELNLIYSSLSKIEEENNFKVDLLICCGDFECVRNSVDNECLNVPNKYKKEENDFKDYYTGKKKAKVLTVFVGGNHEAMNVLKQLYYGGWVAPNIYFLGYSNVHNINNLRIGNLSGIYKKYNYYKKYCEWYPYNELTKVSAYHIRKYEIEKLKLIKEKMDIVITHDWPNNIEKHGDINDLLRRKYHFQSDIYNNTLGNPHTEILLNKLKPQFWFASHLHVKYSAIYLHNDQTNYTRFLSLDKAQPHKHFLQILNIEKKNDILHLNFNHLSNLNTNNQSVKNDTFYDQHDKNSENQQISHKEDSLLDKNENIELNNENSLINTNNNYEIMSKEDKDNFQEKKLNENENPNYEEEQLIKNKENEIKGEIKEEKEEIEIKGKNEIEIIKEDEEKAQVEEEKEKDEDKFVEQKTTKKEQEQKEEQKEEQEQKQEQENENENEIKKEKEETEEKVVNSTKNCENIDFNNNIENKIKSEDFKNEESVEYNINKDKKCYICYDLEWLAILKANHHFISVSSSKDYNLEDLKYPTKEDFQFVEDKLKNIDKITIDNKDYFLVHGYNKPNYKNLYEQRQLFLKRFELEELNIYNECEFNFFNEEIKSLESTENVENLNEQNEVCVSLDNQS
ncbi:RNA lariat debranching enzyme, putative [Plasmodium gallinaceum]|uniref:RNA lariat debranching enzyme, putative n=1 Tax=Plasmodium gallinaceum TaxID=5849 RepID=A0A1J1GRQ9_PLAGA|nr:RNA lariat debranching enzyme, putative [Plasmodium gallinaceum]CRG95114.1 RNA lariat debranching enzyme, putative [Plasmodium gallinaceum]